MSFSSDKAQIVNQAPLTINLPSLQNPTLFTERLEDLLQNFSNTINSKEGGLYTLDEKGSSEQFYIQGNPQRYRNVYRKTLDFVNLNGGNIAAAAAVNFPHDITGIVESAGVYAHCTTTDNRFFTVVFPDIYLDATNAYFTNPLGVALTQCDVIANVLKES